MKQVMHARRTGELRWLVLDEADRLMDLGFQRQLGAAILVRGCHQCAA